MDDDGLVLNLASSEGPIRPRVHHKFTGGSWKDRLDARNAARGRPVRERGSFHKARSDVNEIPIVKSRTTAAEPPHKRRKVEREETESSLHAPSGKPQSSEKRPAAKGGVVSSLFTSNPTPQIAEPDMQEDADADKTQPSNAPLIDGLDTFTSLGLSPTIASHLLTKMGLKNPTAIQRAAVTQMLKEERDAFIRSETGSGKTLAYLLPLVQRIASMSVPSSQQEYGKSVRLDRRSGLFAIVLAPTRELCKQISVVLEHLLGCAHYIVAGTVIGGERKKSEKQRIRKGINILVATPGRLVDHLDNTEALNVSQVRWLILDEGDRLMELGFEEDITKLVRFLEQKKRKSVVPGLPDARTTVLCSATLKGKVQRLGDISLKDAELVVADVDDVEVDAEEPAKIKTYLAPAQLKQSYIVVPAKLRLVTLHALLRHTFARKGSCMKAIVFFSCADSVDYHFSVLTRSTSSTIADSSDNDSPQPTLDAPADSASSTSSAPLISPHLTVYRIHGSLAQHTRTSIIKSFSESDTPCILLATDVASRGLDLPNLDFVIEYDPAFSSDDHLHRIGRTARVGRDGRATIFLMPGLEENYTDILRSSFKPSDAGRPSVTATRLDDILCKGFSPTTGIVKNKQNRRAYEQKATDYQLDVERWILGDETAHAAARKAFLSNVRAYATHVAGERHMFDMKALHLGHLAKAFGLRDAPGNINVQGMRSNGNGFENDVGKKRKRVVTGGSRRGDDDRVDAKHAEKESEDAARKMKAALREKRNMLMGAGADEFNLA
jgi:ATP-dependent RNA helicase DDX31/DBP7